MNILYYKKRYRDWRRLDYEFYAKLIALVAAVVFVTFTVFRGAVFLQRGLLKNIEEAKRAEITNNELKHLYDLGEQLGIKTVELKQLEETKERYSDEEYIIQKEIILNAQSKIADYNCKTGSYVVAQIGDERLPLRVKSYYGYQANTYEGVNFMVTDDKWEFLSRKQYLLLGGKN